MLSSAWFSIVHLAYLIYMSAEFILELLFFYYMLIPVEHIRFLSEFNYCKWWHTSWTSESERILPRTSGQLIQSKYNANLYHWVANKWIRTANNHCTSHTITTVVYHKYRLKLVFDEVTVHNIFNPVEGNILMTHFFKWVLWWFNPSPPVIM